MSEVSVREVSRNRKAYHDYFVDETFEAGIELTGAEVKSIRLGRLNMKDSFCAIKNGEIFIHGLHISPYEKGSWFNGDPMRSRRLLMHKREIMRLYGTVKQDGLAIIPLAVYFRGPRVKVELGLCRGKKLHDKRESEAKKSAEREMDRALRGRA